MSDRLLSARLADLHHCRDRRLLSEEEFSSARQRLIESFACFPASLHSAPVGTASVILEDEGVHCPHSPPPATESAFATIRTMPSMHPVAGPGGGHPEKPRRVLDGCSLRKLLVSMAGFGRGPDLERQSSFLSWEMEKDECEFWCNFLERTKTDASCESGGDQPTMAELQTQDITPGRVQEIFAKRDTDGDGLISRESLVACLRELELEVTYERAGGIMRHVVRGSRDAIEGITLEEFDVMVTHLRLAELFLPAAGSGGDERRPCKMTVCDFDSKYQYDCTWELGVDGDNLNTDVRRFFFGSRERQDRQEKTSWNDNSASVFTQLQAVPPGHLSSSERFVRWVHVDASASAGVDLVTLRRLAAKYRLHPLAVDDVIDNRTPTKMDFFASHYFVSVDILSLADQDPDQDHRGSKLDPKQDRVHVLRSNVSIFLSVPPHCDTILSILQNRPDSSSWLAEWCFAENAWFDGEPSVPNSLWARLVKDLRNVPVRRMREHRADFLLYEVLDRIVDQLRPISEAYSRRLGFMHQHPMRSFPQEWIDEIDEVKLELVDLARSIRPLRQVVRHFVNDARIGGAAKMYLEDVEDAIDQNLGDISQLQEMCRTLAEAHEGYLDQRMNATLFVLSIVSAVFLPAQFITGVYGMNFVDPDGTPGMPELELEHGYVYFWILQAGCLFTGLGAAIFIHQVGDRCCSCSCCARCRTPKRGVRRRRTK